MDFCPWRWRPEHLDGPARAQEASPDEGSTCLLPVKRPKEEGHDLIASGVWESSVLLPFPSTWIRPAARLVDRQISRVDPRSEWSKAVSAEGARKGGQVREGGESGQ